jgi:preprotein translocase subunit YajC
VGEYAGLLPIVAIALLFWLLIIRPASRRQRELSRMQGSLEVGDEVMLTSGVYASVAEIADDHLRVEIAEGVTIRVARGAIGSVIQQPRVVDDEPEEN